MNDEWMRCSSRFFDAWLPRVCRFWLLFRTCACTGAAAGGRTGNLVNERRSIIRKKCARRIKCVRRIKLFRIFRVVRVTLVTPSVMPTNERRLVLSNLGDERDADL